MEIKTELQGKQLVIHTSGRLDASWAEFFSETVSGYIQKGDHQLIFDASGLQFLSSAGIRTFLIIYKKLAEVNGSMQIINAQPVIENTLIMVGFKSWLTGESAPAAGKHAVAAETADDGREVYVLDPGAKLTFSLEAGWKAWDSIDSKMIKRISFPKTVFALGIGEAADREEYSPDQFGDFLAVGGQVIFQPPVENAHPDFLLAEKDYIPELYVLQALCCKGKMSHLLRFNPLADNPSYGISKITAMVMEITRSDAAAFVLLAEIDGMVGAHLVKSPGNKPEGGIVPFPAVRDWISFTGERAFHGKMALLFGIAEKTGNGRAKSLINPLPSDPAISGHFHAAVFHDHPMPNGEIDLAPMLKKILDGPAPLALLHLVDDDRTVTGLGQSTFTRGACWCSAIHNGKEEIS
jgi:anti-anti-sigma factor